jgi:hypothetical protein
MPGVGMRSMKPFGKEQFLIVGCASALLSLSGCGEAGPECGSSDTRNSVVKIIANDSNNKLVNFAVRNSNAVAAMVGDTNVEAEKLAIWEKARRGAVYSLDDTISIKSRDKTAHAATCIGYLDVTVADTTAQKEIEFRVEQKTDGKVQVSVSPFLFKEAK